ncbi:MAG: arsenic resistance N-acetyltransferase ArsN2 [Aestuariivirga sp.]
MIAEAIAGSSAELRAALVTAGLPSDDIEDQGLRFFRFTMNGRIVAYGGLEGHGSSVLLRSLVVLPGEQGKGVGKTTVEHLMSLARASGAETAYLLTTSAVDYFKRLGFRAMAREDAPEAIRATKQATGLCPSAATLLSRSTV